MHFINMYISHFVLQIYELRKPESSKNGDSNAAN